MQEDDRKNSIFSTVWKVFSGLNKTLRLVILGALLVILVLAIMFFKNLFSPKESKIEIDVKSSLEDLIEISELNTLQYTYNAVAETYHENDPSKVVYYTSYEGVVKAGIDTQEIDVKVDDQKKEILVSLPDVRINSVTVDLASMDHIFNDKAYDNKDVAARDTIATEKDLMKKVSEDENLLKYARENAINFIKGLTTPFIDSLDEKYTLEVKWG